MTESISSEELADLQSSVRALLASKSSEAQVRAAIETEAGYDTVLWGQLASQLGLQSLSLPEAHGGDGFGYVALGVVLGELGRAVVPGPFFSSVVLAGSALALCGDDVAQAAHLPGIADGSTVATLAVAEADGSWSTDDLTTEAVRGADGWTVTGSKSLVPDGASADLVIVAASTPDGPSLFAVQAGSGVTATPLRTLDITRPIARVDFEGAAATPVGAPGSAAAILDAVRDRATAALAAEQVGAARACLEMSVSYAIDRVQFGRQIGSFQAVKHKCADMFAKIELASAAVTEALRSVDGLPDAPPVGVSAAVAHSVASEAFMFAAMENIQVHGGIGFTWEHPAHLYFRRAKADQLMFGGPLAYHERLLEQLGV
ncbi:MAG: acrC8 [Aeromicrobium sp.]|nr:acrC8 [Aeromicrobium sp.]